VKLAPPADDGPEKAREGSGRLEGLPGAAFVILVRQVCPRLVLIVEDHRGAAPCGSVSRKSPHSPEGEDPLPSVQGGEHSALLRRTPRATVPPLSEIPGERHFVGVLLDPLPEKVDRDSREPLSRRLHSVGDDLHQRGIGSAPHQGVAGPADELPERAGRLGVELVEVSG
jgi:hypothetical protein